MSGRGKVAVALPLLVYCLSPLCARRFGRVRERTLIVAACPMEAGPRRVVMCCTCICGILLLASVQGGEARKGGGGLRKARPSPWHAADGTGGVRSADGVKPVFAAGFKDLISAAQAHPRRRRMSDFTRNPSENGLQNMMNTWSEGSYSPVHLHEVQAYGCSALPSHNPSPIYNPLPNPVPNPNLIRAGPRRSSRSKAPWPSSLGPIRATIRATRPRHVRLARRSATSSNREAT